MLKRIPILALCLLLSVFLFACNSNGEKEVQQSNNLSVYTAFSEQESLYYLNEFEKETGIKVKFVRLSAGQILARIQAEANNPQASVWYGGPNDTFIAASKLNLLDSYKPNRIR